MKALKELKRIEKPKLGVIDKIVETALAMGNCATEGDRLQLLRAFGTFFGWIAETTPNPHDPEIAILEMSRRTAEARRMKAESTREWQGSPTQVASEMIPFSQCLVRLKQYDFSKLKEILVKADLEKDCFFILRFLDGEDPKGTVDLTLSMPLDDLKKELSNSIYLKEIG